MGPEKASNDQYTIALHLGVQQSVKIFPVVVSTPLEEVSSKVSGAVVVHSGHPVWRIFWLYANSGFDRRQATLYGQLLRCSRLSTPECAISMLSMRRSAISLCIVIVLGPHVVMRREGASKAEACQILS